MSIGLFLRTKLRDAFVMLSGRILLAAEALSIVIDRGELADLPYVVEYLLENHSARFFVADAIARAESESAENVSWDEIVKAALLDLKASPTEGSE